MPLDIPAGCAASSRSTRAELREDRYPADASARGLAAHNVQINCQPLLRNSADIAPHHGVQVSSHPFVRLNVEAVQNAAALRYHTW